MIYLASPYTSEFDEVVEARVQMVKAATAALITKGLPIFSPITYTSDLVGLSGLDGSLTSWQPLDDHILGVSDELWVLMLDGWEKSKGIAHEIEQAEDIGLYIFLVPYPLIYVEGGIERFLLEDEHVYRSYVFYPKKGSEMIIQEGEHPHVKIDPVVKSKAEVVSSVRDALRLYPRGVNLIGVVCFMAGEDDFDEACKVLGRDEMFQAGRMSFRDFYGKVSEAADKCETETKVVRMRTPKVSRAKNISIDVDAQEI